MTDKKLNIKVSTTGAGKTKQELGGLNGAISKMGKAVGIASAAYFGARGLISGFSSVIRLAGEQEKAEAKLNAVIKSTGGAAGLTATELKKMASNLQAVTTFGDETIIGAQSLLLTFTKIGEEVFPQATETILNMAVAMGTDLKSTTVQLGKALNDPITGISALSRVGVQLTDTQKEQIKSFTELGDIASAQKVILGELETQFGGLARTTADTMSGALDQMKNALGDVAENIGESLSPLVVKLAKGINSLATSTADESAEADSLFNVLKDVNATEEVRERAMQAINEQYGDYLPNLIDETFSLQDIEKAQDRVTGAMLKRIALSVNEEKIADLMRDKLGLMDKETTLIDEVKAAHERTLKATDERIAIEKELGGEQIDLMARLEEGRKIAFEDSKKLRLAENREGQIENQKEINKLNEDAIILAQQFSDTILAMPDRPLIIIPQEQIDILEDVIIDWQIMNDLMDETFGKSNELTDTLTDGQKQFTKFSGDLGTAMQNTSQLLATTAGDDIKRQVNAMRIAQFAAIANTAKEATKVLTNPLALIGVLTAGAAQIASIQNAIASAQSVKAAAFGANEIVNKPTMFLTGEAGPERVQVTPLTPGMNKNGPGGITVNVGRFIGSQENADELANIIENRSRLGFNRIATHA